MINTACPKCNTYFNLKDELAFKKVKCPNCGEIFQIIGLEQNNIGTKENLNYFRNSFLNKILKFKLNRLAFFILIIIIIILFLVIDSFTFNNKFFFLRKIIYGLSIIILSIIRLYRLNYIEKDWKFIFIGIIPYFGFLLDFYLLFEDSKSEKQIIKKDYKIHLIIFILFILSLLVGYFGILFLSTFFCQGFPALSSLPTCSIKGIEQIAGSGYGIIILGLFTFGFLFVVHIGICISIIIFDIILLLKTKILWIKIALYLSIIFAFIGILPYIIFLIKNLIL